MQQFFNTNLTTQRGPVDIETVARRCTPETWGTLTDGYFFVLVARKEGKTRKKVNVMFLLVFSA